MKKTGSKAKARVKPAKRKRKVSSAKLPMQRQLYFPYEGKHFDLRALFDKVNARYFRNALRNYTVMWGQKRSQRPKEYFVFGTIQEDDRVIKIHPLLDAPWVPSWFLEFVMYHEMLHALTPDRYDSSGRRIVHHDEFYKRERKFRFYKRAKRWEDANLARFLR
ncbi:MAG TPA: hypothetical protein VG733_19125 [Chthoniobacteraceae bacterium]|nr:hypothetical protein [Chthoniobacteraceae bacterium]